MHIQPSLHRAPQQEPTQDRPLSVLLNTALP